MEDKRVKYKFKNYGNPKQKFSTTKIVLEKDFLSDRHPDGPRAVPGEGGGGRRGQHSLE